MYGLITTDIATHFVLCGSEPFMNFPKNSFAFIVETLIWVVPSPSGENMTPNVHLASLGGNPCSVWMDPSRLLLSLTSCSRASFEHLIELDLKSPYSIPHCCMFDRV
jgi:hypothetical protein